MCSPIQTKDVLSNILNDDALTAIINDQCYDSTRTLIQTKVQTDIPIELKNQLIDLYQKLTVENACHVNSLVKDLINENTTRMFDELDVSKFKWGGAAFAFGLGLMGISLFGYEIYRQGQQNVWLC